jgi:hypothetical protein
MSNAYVADYQGCNITTTAKFISTVSGLPAFGLEKDHILIAVTAPGGASFGGYVALPKAGGDLAFVLKQGDSILLTGGTLAPMLDMGVAGSMQTPVPYFVATAVARSQ